jgi:recombination DNA repair RAD52 pathway protein
LNPLYEKLNYVSVSTTTNLTCPQRKPTISFQYSQKGAQNYGRNNISSKDKTRHFVKQIVGKSSKTLYEPISAMLEAKMTKCERVQHEVSNFNPEGQNRHIRKQSNPNGILHARDLTIYCTTNSHAKSTAN